MTEQRKLPWPPWALALDIVGTLFLAAGLFGHFMADDLPGAKNLEAFAIPLIILGTLLMIPFIAFSILSARRQK